MLPILSSSELRRITGNIKEGLNEIEVSLDLGLSRTKIRLDKKGFFLNNLLIKIPKIREKDKSCYVVNENKLEKVQFFSEETNNMYKLIPTSFRPILKISGTSMHKKEFVDRIKKDRLNGKVLDSGTGIGYTAIAAAKTAEEVITIEADKNVIEIAKLNPYSQELFNNKKIKLSIEDLIQHIKKFKREEFDYLIFDAGNKKDFGNFFSLENYKEAYRILKNKGRLYNYIPKHQIKRGRDFSSEIINRIKQAGFKIIEKNKEDSYVVAQK
ncbi:methyltransferase [Candidatus Woesearchaeota archaeon]|nr:methyltransferase [Candidatus Woesearchaeota archaeon]